MQPLALDGERLAQAIGARPEHVEAVLAGAKPMDAELDLRLAHYFRMSEGFFLGLQADYELLEAKRALNGTLDRIVPRAGDALQLSDHSCSEQGRSNLTSATRPSRAAPR